MTRSDMRKRRPSDLNAASASEPAPPAVFRVAVAWPVGTRDAVLVLQLVQALYNAVWRSAHRQVRVGRPHGAEVLRWTGAADGQWAFTGDPSTCATLVQVWQRCRPLMPPGDGANAPASRPAAWDQMWAEVLKVLPPPGPSGRDMDRSRVVRALWRLLQLEGRGLLQLDGEGPTPSR
jgi:hypothetical protein